MGSGITARGLTPETAMVALWIAWWLSWWTAAIWSDRSVTRPGTRHQILYRVLVAFGVYLIFLQRDPPFLDPNPALWRTAAPIGWSMVGLALLGFMFTWWARIHLGRLWSSNVARKADHHVVDTGPYGLVRHPIYTGIIVVTIATAALRGTVAAWLGVSIMTGGWYIKARMEEGFLREQLGVEAYGSYARRVPMLIPFLRH